MRTIQPALLALLLFGGRSSAQPSDQGLIDALQKLDVRVFKPDSPDAKLRQESLRQARAQVNQRDVEQWRRITTKAEWEKFRDAKIAALRESLGPFPQAPQQVKVVTTKKILGKGFSVENIIYESRPGLYVTANLYVPEDTSKPLPGFLIIHSHHNPKTQGELQDMGMTWARQGCLVLIPDMLGHGERRQHPFVDAKSYPEAFKVSRQDYYFRANVAMQLHLVGESLMGWMVWDLMRGIDVLYQRPNLDKKKLVVFGSVAGGGDPCAVLAALDPRVTGAVPFNFGGPQPETKLPLPDDAELRFNYMGSGSWESTRNLRLSARDGFLPWVIVAALAPRGLIYSHEFAWDEKRDPVWARFQKIWGFYDAKDKLAFVHGRGAVTGKPPTSTHCNNIGPEHRKLIYPTLERWFGLPVPVESRERFPTAELQCWTEEARRTLKPKMVHELALELAQKHLRNYLVTADYGKKFSGIDGLKILDKRERSLEMITDEAWFDGYRLKTQILRHPGDPVLALPLLTIYSANMKEKPAVVIALAQAGKAGFLKQRAETIAQLLKSGVAVCLPDLRGAGETRPAGEGRGRASGATSISATELMHGRNVLGMQGLELALLMQELPKQGYSALALWGDSFAEPNDRQRELAVPHEAERMPRQAEPMGGMLALIGGCFRDPHLKAIYVRGGLIDVRSLLESPFLYVPHETVSPGFLSVWDLEGLAGWDSRQGACAIRLEGLVDGRNRRVGIKKLLQAYPAPKGVAGMPERWTVREVPGSPREVAAWLSRQVVRP